MLFTLLLAPSGQAADDTGIRGFARVLAGAGTIHENQTGTHAGVGLFADGGVVFSEFTRLQLTLDDRVYKQTYLSKNTDADGQFQRVDVDEQYFRSGLGFAIDVFAKSEKIHERSELWLNFIPRGYRFGNRVFRESGGTLGLGVDGLWRPRPGFALTYGGALHASRNFLQLKNETLSALGRPRAFADGFIGAAVASDEEGAWSLEAQWRFDFVGFDHAIRNYQTAVAGVSFRI